MTVPPEVPQVDAAEAAQLVTDGAFFLDVREDDEWQAGHAPEATHVRLGELPDRVLDVPTDRTVISVCRGGGRSQKAAEFLRARGVDAVNLAGGMKAWSEAGRDVVAEDGTPGAVI